MKNLLSILCLLFSFQVDAASSVHFFEDLEPNENRDIYVIGKDRVIVCRRKDDLLDFSVVLDGRSFNFKSHLSTLAKEVDVNSYILSQSVVSPKKFKIRIPFGDPRRVNVMGEELVKRDFIYFIIDADGGFEKEIFRWPEVID